MLVRGVRAGFAMAACLVACALFIAPSGQAHPEECLSGAATWTTVAGFDEEKFLSHRRGLPARRGHRRYDDSGAQLEAGEIEENGLELLANRAEAGRASRAQRTSTPTSPSGATSPSRATTTASRSSTSPTRRTRQIVSQVLLPGLAERHLRLERPALPLHGLAAAATTAARARRSPPRIKAVVGGHQDLRHRRPAQPALHQVASRPKCGSHTHTLVPDGDTALALRLVLRAERRRSRTASRRTT